MEEIAKMNEMVNPIRLLFVGDFCSRPSCSLIEVDNELRSLIQSCDAACVNFEVPLKPANNLPSIKYERFFQNDDAPSFLKELGFTLFPQANNHAFDWGKNGFEKTQAILGDTFGSGSYEDAYRVKVIDIKGAKIGFLAVCLASRFGVFDNVMHREELGCAYINDLRVNHVIIEAKKNVDYLFVLPHDGIEYIDVPLPETMARYRDFIDYGADGVIACHPHCPQGWETYKEKPIFYSLGNFFFNSKETPKFHCTKPHWYEGLCVVLEISNNISCKVYNTINKDNVELGLDDRDKRLRDNELLCLHLNDIDAYRTYIQNSLPARTAFDFSLLDSSISGGKMGDIVKVLFKRWINRLKGKTKQNDEILKDLLKNDTRRNAIINIVTFKK